MGVNQQPLIVGTFGAPYGVRGWLKVHAMTENRYDMIKYQPWLVQRQGSWSPILLADWKQPDKNLLVKLAGIDDRDSAQSMVSSTIAIDATQLPPLPDGEYYWCQLIGCQVVNTANYRLGIVTQLLETGANDVLVVKATANDIYSKSERLLPWIEPRVIQQVDLANRLLTVDWDPEF
ncbi:MAG: ribosome maturation factor RimM [Candidatus Symbiodolus clandestinus]